MLRRLYQTAHKNVVAGCIQIHTGAALTQNQIRYTGNQAACIAIRHFHAAGGSAAGHNHFPGAGTQDAAGRNLAAADQIHTGDTVVEGQIFTDTHHAGKSSAGCVCQRYIGFTVPNGQFFFCFAHKAGGMQLLFAGVRDRVFCTALADLTVTITDQAAKGLFCFFVGNQLQCAAAVGNGNKGFSVIFLNAAQKTTHGFSAQCQIGATVGKRGHTVVGRVVFVCFTVKTAGNFTGDRTCGNTVFKGSVTDAKKTAGNRMDIGSDRFGLIRTGNGSVVCAVGKGHTVVVICNTDQTAGDTAGNDTVMNTADEAAFLTVGIAHQTTHLSAQIQHFRLDDGARGQTVGNHK